MNTDLGEKLQNAMDKAVNNFVWKEKNGTEVKLVDATPAELSK